MSSVTVYGNFFIVISTIFNFVDNHNFSQLEYTFIFFLNHCVTDFLLYFEESFIRLSEPKDQERFSDQNLFIVCHHCLWHHHGKHSTNLGIKYFYVYSSSTCSKESPNSFSRGL